MHVKDSPKALGSKLCCVKQEWFIGLRADEQDYSSSSDTWGAQIARMTALLCSSTPDLGTQVADENYLDMVTATDMGLTQGLCLSEKTGGGSLTAG